MVETKKSSLQDGGILTEQEELAIEEAVRKSREADVTSTYDDFNGASSVDENISLEENIDIFVERMFAPKPMLLRSDGGDGIDSMADTAGGGLSTTTDIITNVSSTVSSSAGSGTWKFLAKAEILMDKVIRVYNAGKAVLDIINFFANMGKPSEHEQILNKLNEISQQLRKVEAAVRQGFADLIAHSDFINYRNKVAIPTRVLFDAYVRCFTVSGEAPVKDFKKDCEGENSPRHILSTIHAFLETSNSNIIATHLKADKYLYSTYKRWTEIIFHHAVLSITINVFYLGLVTAGSPKEKKEKMELSAKSEIKDLFRQLTEIGQKLTAIELDRLKQFHSTGAGREYIKKIIDEIKPPKPDRYSKFPPELLPKLAYEFKEKWQKFNGPQDFYVVICRGRVPVGNESEFRLRHARFINNDKERVTVAANVAYQTAEADTYNAQDAISVALIQPLTKEILEANRLTKETEDKINKILTDSRSVLHILAATMEKINKLKSKKPLLVIYNTDSNREDVTFERLDIRNAEFAYRCVGEAWSAPGGPFPKKFEWYASRMTAAQPVLPSSARRVVQVIFQ